MTRSRNIFILFLTTTIFCQIPSLFAIDAVPVLLWGGKDISNSERSPVNPFSKTSRAEFGDIVINRVGSLQPPVLVFLKDNLCVEDFTQHKEQLQKVTNGGSLAYLPAVETPLSVFKDLTTYNQTYDEDADSVSDGQLLIRPISNLDFISEIYNNIKESSPNLIAALTGKSCNYRRSERVRRSTEAETNSTNFLIKSERVLLYSSENPFLKTTEQSDFVQIPNPIIVKDYGQGTEKDPLILRLQFGGPEGAPAIKYAIHFAFVIRPAGYYVLTNATYKKEDSSDVPEFVLSTKSDIVFPFNFSYHCSQNTVFQKSPVILKLTNLQVQIDADSFGDAYDCVGFTSIPIWTGIFVTLILALIMIWAITMIIDIRTMDRFDDPKGKTITISAQE